jgi:hypothetical protein
VSSWILGYLESRIIDIVGQDYIMSQSAFGSAWDVVDAFYLLHVVSIFPVLAYLHCRVDEALAHGRRYVVMHHHGRSHSHQRYGCRLDLPAANGHIVIEDVPAIEEDEKEE